MSFLSFSRFFLFLFFSLFLYGIGTRLLSPQSAPGLRSAPISKSLFREDKQEGKSYDSLPSQDKSKAAPSEASKKNPLGFAFPLHEQKKTARRLNLYHLTSRLLWYIQTKQNKISLSLFRRLKKDFPDSSETRYFQALYHYKTGRQAQALSSLEKSLGKNPDFARAWNLKGLLFSNAEQNVDALHCFQKASEINPYHQNYIYNLGLAFYKLGEYAKAMTMSKRALQLKSNYSSPHYLQALIYRRQGHSYKAFASFTLAEEFGQKGREFYLDYLDLAQELGELTEGLRLAKLLSKKRNKNAPLLRSLASVWQKSGDYSRALVYLRALLHKKDEVNNRDYKNYVFVLVKKGLKTSPRIHALPLKKEEKEKLKLYAQNLRKEFNRLKLLKAQDPVIR